MAIAFETPRISGIARRYMEKFGDKAVREIAKALQKVGDQEAKNTSNRLFSRSTASEDIFDKVGRGVYSELLEVSDDNISLEFGSDTGQPGSRGANIAAILAFGKSTGSPLSMRKFATPAKKSGTGHKILLPKGYVSPARPEERMFFPRAQKNIRKNLEKKVPEALRKAFGEVSF